MHLIFIFFTFFFFFLSKIFHPCTFKFLVDQIYVNAFTHELRDVHIVYPVSPVLFERRSPYSFIFTEVHLFGINSSPPPPLSLKPYPIYLGSAFCFILIHTSLFDIVFVIRHSNLPLPTTSFQLSSLYFSPFGSLNL